MGVEEGVVRALLPRARRREVSSSAPVKSLSPFAVDLCSYHVALAEPVVSAARPPVALAPGSVGQKVIPPAPTRVISHGAMGEAYVSLVAEASR